MSNLTFGIIKPDAVRAGATGSIVQQILDQGFKIRGLKLIHMTASRRFLRGPSRTPVLRGPDGVHVERTVRRDGARERGAVKAWRDLMGATDPAKADEGTLRKQFGGSVGENAVHGSDSDENAAIEISYFFSRLELV